MVFINGVNKNPPREFAALKIFKVSSQGAVTDCVCVNFYKCFLAIISTFIRVLCQMQVQKNGILENSFRESFSLSVKGLYGVKFIQISIMFEFPSSINNFSLVRYSYLNSKHNVTTEIQQKIVKLQISRNQTNVHQYANTDLELCS